MNLPKDYCGSPFIKTAPMRLTGHMSSAWAPHLPFLPVLMSSTLHWFWLHPLLYPVPLMRPTQPYPTNHLYFGLILKSEHLPYSLTPDCLWVKTEPPAFVIWPPRCLSFPFEAFLHPTYNHLEHLFSRSYLYIYPCSLISILPSHHDSCPIGETPRISQDLFYTVHYGLSVTAPKPSAAM